MPQFDDQGVEGAATHSQSSATAYHEAGHAVVALVLGRDVHRVSVKPNQRRLGYCRFKKGSFRPSKDALETEALILLAGLAAEARHLGTYAWEGASQDLLGVRELTQMRGGSQRQVERLERRLLDKTEYLLDDSATWLAVERIATELVKSQTISGRAARYLFDQAKAEIQKRESGR